MSGERFSVELTLRGGYEFAADFNLPNVPDLVLDEPAPLGTGAGPNAARILAAAVANCLSASLLLCLRKAHVDVPELRATVSGTFERNERGRLRIAGLDVTLQPSVAPEQQPRMQRCLELFEDFCIVTQSVRAGIDVRVTVAPVPGPAVPA